MLRYSYRVEVLKLKGELKALQLQFFKSGNKKVEEVMKEKQKEIDWFEQKIEEGKDPGVSVL